MLDTHEQVAANTGTTFILRLHCPPPPPFLSSFLFPLAGSPASLRIVNTYGNFGSITKRRGEVVLKGTRHRDPLDPAAEWREYGKFLPFCCA